jgi:hypothetical protein
VTADALKQASDKCSFVQSNCDDAGASTFGSYLELYYCGVGGGAAGMVLMVLLLLLTIVVLGTTADDYFVPQLKYISRRLRMRPDIAGITFLAVGNGAGDIFASIAVAKTADFPFLLAGLLGASVFISTVILACVALFASTGGRTWTVERVPFWRDILAYLVCLSAILALASGGTIYIAESVAFLAIYAAYICTVRPRGWNTVPPPLVPERAGSLHSRRAAGAAAAARAGSPWRLGAHPSAAPGLAERPELATGVAERGAAAAGGGAERAALARRAGGGRRGGRRGTGCHCRGARQAARGKDGGNRPTQAAALVAGRRLPPRRLRGSGGRGRAVHLFTPLLRRPLGVDPLV